MVLTEVVVLWQLRRSARSLAQVPLVAHLWRPAAASAFAAASCWLLGFRLGLPNIAALALSALLFAAVYLGVLLATGESTLVRWLPGRRVAVTREGSTHR